MQRVVVTGGAGFIGSHLVDSLIASGVETHVLDNLASGRREQVAETAILHELDIRDIDALTNFRSDVGTIDCWFHLAAQADVRVSVADPRFDADVNVLGTLCVLEIARMDSAPVIFASTGGAIYGEGSVPADEHVPARPASPYGAAKLAAEGYLAQDARLHGARHVALRFANVYGPRQDPHGEAGVIAIFAGKIANGDAATIFGDGSQTRDYVEVADVVEAVMAASAAALNSGDSNLRADGDIPIYNVGTGIETSVVDLWNAMTTAAERDPGFVRAPARLGELQRSALDATRVRSTLDVPIATRLVEGVAGVLGQPAGS